MKKLYLVFLVLLAGCDMKALSPGDTCWWKYTAYAVTTDTVWNTVPNPNMPYWLVTGKKWTDSTRVCSK